MMSEVCGEFVVLAGNAMQSFDGEIIDCHIHPVVEGSLQGGWFTGCGDFREQMDDLRRAGIVRACGAPVQTLDGRSFSPIRALNDQALVLRDRFPGFYFPGIHVHPRFPQESCGEIERCCGREGVRWIGELVGYMMGYANEYATPDALTIMRTAARFGATVNFHCHDLQVIDELCAAVPEVKLVLAHPGQTKADIMERVGRLARYPNLHLDISGTGIDRYGILRMAMDMAGKEKLLFGTDSPINNPAVYAGGALHEKLTPVERSALFAGNFRRLTALFSS